ncbi:hypothetical protein [Arthrobacter sp. H14]|uniref:hypothetical protein n=1 Tax=Arthrobacter sp. H14 TaxID=1312959 RepID=UPI00047AC118|nr:hypothetical protein [Arthrobacter sp. H14]
MGGHEEPLSRRIEEVRSLYEQGGPQLEAYLRQGAIESLEAAVFELDDAARNLSGAVAEGQTQGLPLEEIRTMIDKLALEAQVYGPQSPDRLVKVHLSVLPGIDSADKL